MKTAIITGITGMDGSYLADYLISKDYIVHGLMRRSSIFSTERIEHIYDNPNLHLHYGDLSDSNSINKVILETEPDEIYNLAAQSHVAVSFEIPEYTSDITGIGNLRILESIKNINQKIKLYQASTSELFGSSPPPQNEETVFQPRSPYAVSKLMSYWNTINYRDGYGIFATNGILFNHEGPRRLETFVTRKITKGICKVLSGTQDVLELGNLDARRDWGYAPEYIMLMHQLLQLDNPGDFVMGTGESHSIRDFVNECMNILHIETTWTGVGLNEKLIVKSNDSNFKKRVSGDVLITINPKYYRPTEVDALEADASKIKTELNWKPKVKMKELVHIMLMEDINREMSGTYIETNTKNEFKWLGRP